MINGLIHNQNNDSWNRTVSWDINISDKITATPQFFTVTGSGVTLYYVSYPYILFELESQQTKKKKLFTKTSGSYYCGRNANAFERWVQLNFLYQVSTTVVEDLSASRVKIGNDEYPLGFYNLTIYETHTNGELNPANAAGVVYKDILHLRPFFSETNPTGNFEEVKYTDYATNDSDTESVYITF